MIWNDEVVFIHAPKTAGMSLTEYLGNGLRGEVKITGHDKQKRVGSKVLLPGKRHETMAEAAQLLELRGRKIENFKRVFVVMREPYTLEISRYNYLRLNHAVDRGPAQKIALEGDFRNYLASAPFFGFNPPRLDLYYHIFGRILDNAVFLSFENLSKDLEIHVAPFMKSAATLPHVNKTGKSVFSEYYNTETEELCYSRHRWFFDKGFYRRKIL